MVSLYVVNNIISVMQQKRTGERKIIAFFFSLSVGKAKGRKEKENRIKIDHFNFHNTIY
jgi:hypothetical protein